MASESEVRVAQQVLVKGKAFRWCAEEGLDPEAVVELGGWIATLARRYAQRAPWVNMDDLVQAGYVGALEAARCYDPALCSFISYSKFKIMTELRNLMEPPPVLSLDAPNKLTERPWHEDLGDASGAFVKAQAEAVLDAELVLSRLGDKERLLLEELYGVGREQRSSAEIARASGVSKQAIRARSLKARKAVVSGKWKVASDKWQVVSGKGDPMRINSREYRQKHRQMSIKDYIDEQVRQEKAIVQAAFEEHKRKKEAAKGMPLCDMETGECLV